METKHNWYITIDISELRTTKTNTRFAQKITNYNRKYIKNTKEMKQKCLYTKTKYTIKY